RVAPRRPRATLLPYTTLFRSDGQPLQGDHYAAEVDGLRLHGHIRQIHPQGLVRLHAGTPGATQMLRDGLDWLLVSANDDDKPRLDRKSTRLNSSHVKISYAVF